MLQMITSKKAVIKVKSETFVSKLNVQGFVVDQRKPNIGFSPCCHLSLFLSESLLQPCSAFLCENISIYFKKVLMNEILMNDAIRMIVELTPNIEIYLNRLGHIVKKGFDLYKS